jgi:hypothetical protein
MMDLTLLLLLLLLWGYIVEEEKKEDDTRSAEYMRRLAIRGHDDVYAMGAAWTKHIHKCLHACVSMNPALGVRSLPCPLVDLGLP